MQPLNWAESFFVWRRWPEWHDWLPAEILKSPFYSRCFEEAGRNIYESDTLHSLLRSPLSEPLLDSYVADVPHTHWCHAWTLLRRSDSKRVISAFWRLQRYDPCEKKVGWDFWHFLLWFSTELARLLSSYGRYHSMLLCVCVWTINVKLKDQTER